MAYIKNKGLSIIIPAWKALKWINNCLQSIYNNSWIKTNSNWEILIGIDCCLETKYAINFNENFTQNLKLFFFTEHSGPYIIRNTLAYKEAKYPNLLFFDSDDTMEFDLIMSCFVSNKSFITFQYGKSKNGFLTSCGSSFVKKHLLFKYGGYQSWKCAADSDFIKRLVADGCEHFKLVGKNYMNRGTHTNQLTKRKDTGIGTTLRTSYHLKTNENLKNKIYYINPQFNEYKNITEEKRMAPKCIICIPFFSEEPERKKAFKSVYDHYSKLGYNIFIGESDPFTRAAARNGSVPNIDFDVLFFADADIIVPLEQIQEAIYLAYEKNEMVIAYEDLLLLDKEQTDFFYKTNKFDSFEKKLIKNQISGSFAITKKLWNQVGGYDERFKEWGGEDRAFYYSCAAVKNKFENKRIKGSAYHLFHKRKETEQFQFLSENCLLKKYKNSLELSDKFYTYKEILQDNKPLFSILKEKNGPLNFETEGYLSCPMEILSSLPYSKPTINEPLIGVTIPCFKSKETIKRALLSVINQTHQNSIIFVVSDGDISSFEFVKEINNKRVLFLRSKYNLGRYAIDHLLCTHILPMFGCKYWAPIDSDDYVDSNYLELLYEKIQSGSIKYDVVFSNQMRHRLNGVIDIVKVKPRTNEMKLFRSASMLSLWNLNFILENNLTNPAYRIGWDTLMTLATQMIGKYAIIQEPIYHIVKTPNSLSLSEKTGHTSQYRKEVRIKLQEIWKQILNNPKNTPEILRRSRCPKECFG